MRTPHISIRGRLQISGEWQKLNQYPKKTMMVEFNTSFVNNNNDHNLTCQVIANSCHILDDIINPEYEDTLYADDMTWILVGRVFFYLHYLFNHLYTHIYPLILYRHRLSLSLQCRVDLQCWKLVYHHLGMKLMLC